MLNKSNSASILTITGTTSEFSCSIMVSTGSASGNNISTSRISFSALRLRHHGRGTSFVTIINSDFSRGQVYSETGRRSITLFKVDRLRGLLGLRRRVPLISRSCGVLFRGSKSVSLNSLRPTVTHFEQAAGLLSLILETLLSRGRSGRFNNIVSGQSIC